MLTHKNLTLIGTSHIAPEAASAVTKAIEETVPGIVALELDKKRLYALLNPSKQKLSWRDIPRIGIQGSIFALLGAWAEKSLGKHVGTKPGVEMLAAYHTAQKKGSRIALIDQDIEKTLKQIKLPWKERWHLLVDIIKGLVFRKQTIKFDLRTVPEEDVIHQLIKLMKDRYPSLHKTLVEERNEFMAKQLVSLMIYEKEKPIIAVIGAGHVKEMMVLVKKYLNSSIAN
ncbi:MAG: TraB/GumN family protein [Candidatus Woesearchaeota archaeon]|nr:TraB/GumN family protein [Candidatus Woesearchaeota archaeon]